MALKLVISTFLISFPILSFASQKATLQKKEAPISQKVEAELNQIKQQIEKLEKELKDGAKKKKENAKSSLNKAEDDARDIVNKGLNEVADVLGTLEKKVRNMADDK